MSESLSFVLAKDVHFTDAQLYGKVGDLVVYTPPSKLVVYRNGEIMKAFELAKVSIQGLVNIKALIADDSLKANTPVEEIKAVAVALVAKTKEVVAEVVDEVEHLIKSEVEDTPAAPEVAPEVVAEVEETEDIPESEETPEQVAEAATTGVKPKRVKKAPATK